MFLWKFTPKQFHPTLELRDPITMSFNICFRYFPDEGLCWLRYFIIFGVAFHPYFFASWRHCVLLMSYILVLFWMPTVSCALLSFIQLLWKVPYPSFPIILIEWSSRLYPFTLRNDKLKCRICFLSFNIWFCHLYLMPYFLIQKLKAVVISDKNYFK